MTSEPGRSILTSKPDGYATEVEISMDLIKRGLMAGPVLIAICGVIWGADGAWSSAYAIAIVLANFVDRNNTRMVQVCRRFGFGIEALDIRLAS